MMTIWRINRAKASVCKPSGRTCLPRRRHGAAGFARVLRLGFLLCILLISLKAIANDTIPYEAEASITVGLRADARPFSYQSTAHADEELLPGYSGYMVEICRRVLSEMVTRGPFAGYRVDTRPVSTEKRLHDLDRGKVDMLCGPDSITLDRLYRYNTSHPLFLSGITYATVENHLFPKGRYCGAVIGLVAGTTAETEGLRKIADSNALQLYDSALESFLARNTDSAQAPVDLLMRIRKLDADIDSGFSTQKDQARGVDRIDPAQVTTAYCPNGFTQGPVIFYESHQQGIDDLCAGKILFYVADVDILSERIGECPVILQRETMTREAYGIYFRRNTETLDQTSEVAHFPDSALYAEFNNVLLRKMQTTENILDYEFSHEFKNESPTEDLQRFFDGYKFVVDF